MKNYVSASVLSADLLDMRNEIKKLETNGVDMLHFDVMDGIFVNNITYGLPVLEQVRRVTDMTLDVHHFKSLRSQGSSGYKAGYSRRERL